jgi:hypothetical protein
MHLWIISNRYANMQRQGRETMYLLQLPGLVILRYQPRSLVILRNRQLKGDIRRSRQFSQAGRDILRN